MWCEGDLDQEPMNRTIWGVYLGFVTVWLVNDLIFGGSTGIYRMHSFWYVNCISRVWVFGCRLVLKCFDLRCFVQLMVWGARFRLLSRQVIKYTSGSLICRSTRWSEMAADTTRKEVLEGLQQLNLKQLLQVSTGLDVTVAEEKTTTSWKQYSMQAWGIWHQKKWKIWMMRKCQYSWS